MKVVVRHRSFKSNLGLIQWPLFAGALAMLGYCGFSLSESWLFQNREGQRLEALRENPSPELAATKIRQGLEGLVGRISIPRLDVSVIIAEGVDYKTLRHAAGHIPGTPLPGQSGNMGISAHRDTFFRPLRNIRRDDVITITTARAEFRYRVVSTMIVKPEDYSVLAASRGESLTLVTCYPFYFVGPAPSRFIVRAERIT